MTAGVVSLALLSGCYDLGALPGDYRGDGGADAGHDAGMSIDGFPAGFTTLSVFAGTTGGAGAVTTADLYSSTDKTFVDSPISLCTDSMNNVYYADHNAAIVGMMTSTGEVSILAGQPYLSGAVDAAKGVDARFLSPYGCLLSADEKTLYISDFLNSAVRAIDLTTSDHAVTTVLGILGMYGFDSGGKLGYPAGMWRDPAAGYIYLVDQGICTVSKVTFAPAASIQVVAGIATMCGYAEGNPGTTAKFESPTFIAGDGDLLYVSDTNNRLIRSLDPSNNYETALLAGMQGDPADVPGTYTSAAFYEPMAIQYTTSSFGYVSDETHLRVLNGTDVIDSTSFPAPLGIDFLGKSDATPSGLIGGTGDHRIVSATFINSSTLAAPTTQAGVQERSGNQDGTSPTWYHPNGVYLGGSGSAQILYITDTGNGRVRTLDENGASKAFADVAGSPASTGGVALQPIAITGDAMGNLYVTGQIQSSGASSNNILRIDSMGVVTVFAGDPGNASGSTNAVGTLARFNKPGAVTVLGETLYVANVGNDTLRTVDLGNGSVMTLSPTGLGNIMGCNNRNGLVTPAGLVGDGPKNKLYVANGGCNILAIDLSSMQVSVLAAGESGADMGSTALLIAPAGLAFDGDHTLYVADPLSGMVSEVDTANGDVRPLAGQALRHGVYPGTLPARLNRPVGLAFWPELGLIVSAPYENALLRIH